jgi:hypothetical protein
MSAIESRFAIAGVPPAGNLLYTSGQIPLFLAGFHAPIVGRFCAPHDRITIIPFVQGKLTRDGKVSEPDIHYILEKWKKRHPEAEGREIRISRGGRALLGGIRTELIRVTMVYNETFAEYDPATDIDLYEYYVADADPE